MASGTVLRPSRIFQDTNSQYAFRRSTLAWGSKTVKAHKGTVATVPIAIPSGWTLIFNVCAQVQGTAGFAAAVDTGEYSSSAAVYITNVTASDITTGANTIVIVNSFFRTN